MHKVEHGPRIVRFRIVGGRARKPQRERERESEVVLRLNLGAAAQKLRLCSLGFEGFASRAYGLGFKG